MLAVNYYCHDMDDHLEDYYQWRWAHTHCDSLLLSKSQAGNGRDSGAATVSVVTSLLATTAAALATQEKEGYKVRPAVVSLWSHFWDCKPVHISVSVLFCFFI